MTTFKILILGNGYMGNYIQTHLSTVGHDVTKVSASELDYHDPVILNRYLLNNGIDVVINCSGFTGRPNIDEAEIKKELCWDLNVISPLRVNKICDKNNIRYIHISSGCVYDGYEKRWSENDRPNFGLFSNNSSFYSKSKHAFEMFSQDLAGTILRIRMPFGPDSSSRNYLWKIRNYNNLINFINSKTYIPDLCGAVESLIQTSANKREIYNVVNPNPLSTETVCEIMTEHGFHNINWNWVNLSDLPIATGRSNCVLDNSKLNTIYEMKSEEVALVECLLKVKNKI